MCFLLVQGVSAATSIGSCTTISTSGEYELTVDIIDSTDTVCIDIQANDVVLDCQGHNVDGNNSGNGIRIFRSPKENSNVVIKNCVVTDWYNGIYLINADNNTILNNTANNNTYGIHQGNSNNNFISGNTANFNSHGISTLLGSNNTVIVNNTANNNSHYGIYMASYSPNPLITNTKITGNIANLNKYGIYLQYSNNNIISGNTANSNTNEGIRLTTTTDGSIFNNIFLNNEFGTVLMSSNNNTIYNNYFDNKYNGYDYGGNFWNTTNHTGINIIGGPNIGGNYFADYKYTDTNGDGFGEVPYVPFGGQGSKDYLPLAIPEVPTIFLSIGMMFLSMLRMKKKLE